MLLKITISAAAVVMMTASAFAQAGAPLTGPRASLGGLGPNFRPPPNVPGPYPMMGQPTKSLRTGSSGGNYATTIGDSYSATIGKPYGDISTLRR